MISKFYTVSFMLSYDHIKVYEIQHFYALSTMQRSGAINPTPFQDPGSWKPARDDSFVLNTVISIGNVKASSSPQIAKHTIWCRWSLLVDRSFCQKHRTPSPSTEIAALFYWSINCNFQCTGPNVHVGLSQAGSNAS